MANIKDSIISRFEGGSILEADFSQLEIIALAYLSQDRQLYEDINNGVDYHCRSASFLYSTPYDVIRKAYLDGDKLWTKRRKIAKGPGFLIVYGGTEFGMSKKTGLSKEQCKTFIDNWYGAYSGVKFWHGLLQAQVDSSKVPSSRRTESGLPTMKGFINSVSGRRYVFSQYEKSRKNYKTGQREKIAEFNAAQIKNYPVQGFATGDVVPLMLGVLFKHLVSIDFIGKKCYLINTVHDSVILDVRQGEERLVAQEVKKVLEDAPMYIRDAGWGDFDLPLKVDVEWGPTWDRLVNKL